DRVGEEWVDPGVRSPGRGRPDVLPNPSEVQMDFFVVIPAVAGIIAVVLVTTMRVKRAELRRHLLHEERMAAIAKGVPIPEDIEIEASGDLKPPGRDPALHGTILAALGLGMLAAS